MPLLGGKRKSKTRSRRRRSKSRTKRRRSRSRRSRSHNSMMVGGRSKSSKKCPSGQILRSGYTRTSRSGKKTYVHPSCIEDRGKPGKGKKLFDLKEGSMKKEGYDTFASATSRHNALKKLVETEGQNKVIHQLNAIRVLNKNRPDLHKIYTDDMKWVQNNL